MVRRLLRQRRDMAVGSTDLHIMADDDAVETGNGARRVKAFGGAPAGDGERQVRSARRCPTIG